MEDKKKEIVSKMRESLAIAGYDTSVMTDEEVFQWGLGFFDKLAKIGEGLVEALSKIFEAVAECGCSLSEFGEG